jgi:hypothetical protein
MSSFGFIMTRHVNSELTNNYWNHSVKLLRTFYPDKKIVIIDDNSNYDYVKDEIKRCILNYFDNHIREIKLMQKLVKIN